MATPTATASKRLQQQQQHRGHLSPAQQAGACTQHQTGLPPAGTMGKLPATQQGLGCHTHALAGTHTISPSTRLLPAPAFPHGTQLHPQQIRRELENAAPTSRGPRQAGRGKRPQHSTHTCNKPGHIHQCHSTTSPASSGRSPPTASNTTTTDTDTAAAATTTRPCPRSPTTSCGDQPRARCTAHPASPRREQPAANNAAATTDAPTANAAAADGPCPQTPTAGCHDHAPARRGRTPSRDPTAPHHTQDKAGDQSTPAQPPPDVATARLRPTAETATTTSPTEPARHRPQSGEQCSRDRPDTTTTDR